MSSHVGLLLVLKFGEGVNTLCADHFLTLCAKGARVCMHATPN